MGPLMPFTGTIYASYTSLTLTFAVLDTDATTLNVYLEITDKLGNKCFLKVSASLPDCSWIGEKHNVTGITKTDSVVQMSNAMLVYPNPATKEVNVSYDYGSQQYKERSISVYDQLGRKVQYISVQDTHGNWNLNAEEWMPGMYIIRMEGDGKALQTQRLIVNN